jgi:hypothetical protein
MGEGGTETQKNVVGFSSASALAFTGNHRSQLSTRMEVPLSTWRLEIQIGSGGGMPKVSDWSSVSVSVEVSHDEEVSDNAVPSVLFLSSSHACLRSWSRCCGGSSTLSLPHRFRWFHTTYPSDDAMGESPSTSMPMVTWGVGWSA